MPKLIVLTAAHEVVAAAMMKERGSGTVLNAAAVHGRAASSQFPLLFATAAACAATLMATVFFVRHGQAAVVRPVPLLG